MQLFRRWDPRLDPTLRPHEWEGVRRRHRIRLTLTLALLVAVLIAATVFVRYPVDRTRDLTPVEIAESAGMILLQSSGYQFSARLTGEGADNLFPDMTLKGEYQKSPQVLHLSGHVTTGDSRVNLEYYLEGSSLYVRTPTNPAWVLVQDAAQDDVTSFFPDNLAAPLVSGVFRADVVGTQKFPQGNAVQLKLDLDPNVMLPNAPALQSDKTEYMLWVYTRTLRPARFTIQVLPQPNAGGQPPAASHYEYVLDLDFTKPPLLSIPPEIKANAQPVYSNTDQGQVPPKPPEQPGDATSTETAPTDVPPTGN